MRKTVTIHGIRNLVQDWKKTGERVGFVPTMGALHDGHMALIRHSRKICDRSVVSIFVNPSQFGPGEDYKSYPRTLATDLAACRREGVDAVFAPDARTMYPEGFDSMVQAGRLGNILEGEIRPGHFDGVATIVLKLFAIVDPDVAVFGQKDYQQAAILIRMTNDLNLPVRILVQPTVRESDGLALSSRNTYLDPLSRREATCLIRTLKWAEAEVCNGRVNVAVLQAAMKGKVEEAGVFSLDYAEFCDPISLDRKKLANPPLVILIAATCHHSGPAKGRRFIDNILIPA